MSLNHDSDGCLFGWPRGLHRSSFFNVIHGEHKSREDSTVAYLTGEYHVVDFARRSYNMALGM